MLDYRIDNALIIDGTGKEGYVGSIGVRAGRIVESPGTESARQCIDADGLAVAPGFIEIHTHYDAQLFWDPWVNPSLAHGITTVVAGNCGLAIAPASAEHVDFLTRLMARVEGMPIEALESGVPWDWRDYSGYAQKFAGRLAVNVGFLAGHSTIRRVVMGEAASERAASPDETARMTALLGEILDQGAIGYSTSFAQPHHDGDGRPVPSRFATRDEVLALCAETGRHPGTFLELSPLQGLFSEETRALLTDMSATARRPLNWNLYVPGLAPPEVLANQIAVSDYAKARGGNVLALMMPIPMVMRSSFLSGFVLDSLPGWGQLFLLRSAARIEALKDPATRARMKAGLEATPDALKRATRFDRLVVTETYAEENARFRGRLLGDIAREAGQPVLDVMLDIVVRDALRTGLQQAGRDDSDALWKTLAANWFDPRTVVGGSDAGAHVDALFAANYPLVMIEEARRRQLAPLEKVIHVLTDVPARRFGIRERGRIADGWHADLVILDPQRAGSETPGIVADLPGGGPRLTSRGKGIRHVFVNGVAVLNGQDPTGDLSGIVLRSGRDTQTVEPTPLAG